MSFVFLSFIFMMMMSTFFFAPATGKTRRLYLDNKKKKKREPTCRRRCPFYIVVGVDCHLKHSSLSKFSNGSPYMAPFCPSIHKRYQYCAIQEERGGDGWNVQSVFVILVGSTGWSVFSPPPPLCSSDGPRVLPQGVEHLVSIYTFFGLLIQCFSHSITILFSFLLTCWFSLSEGGG